MSTKLRLNDPVMREHYNRVNNLTQKRRLSESDKKTINQARDFYEDNIQEVLKMPQGIEQQELNAYMNSLGNLLARFYEDKNFIKHQTQQRISSVGLQERSNGTTTKQTLELKDVDITDKKQLSNYLGYDISSIDTDNLFTHFDYLKKKLGGDGYYDAARNKETKEGIEWDITNGIYHGKKLQPSDITDIRKFLNKYEENSDLKQKVDYIVGEGKGDISAAKQISTGGVALEDQSTEINNSSFQDLFAGNTDRVGYSDKYPRIKDSVAKMLQGKDIISFYRDFDDLFKKWENPKNNIRTVTFFNNSELITFLKKNGYEFTKTDKSPEIVLVFSIVQDYALAQEKLRNTTDEKEYIKLLFDYHGEGKLKGVGSKELGGQNYFNTVHAISLLDRDGINALLKNLGLGGIKQFFPEMQSNLFVAKEKFNNALTAAINRGVNITELVKDGKMPNKTLMLIESNDKIKNSIRVAVKNHFANVGHKELAVGSGPKQLEYIEKSLITGIYASYINNKFGIGTGVDIQKYTKGILDSITVSYSDGKIIPSVNASVFRETLANLGASATLSAGTTGVRGTVAKNFRIGESDIKELFATTMDNNYVLTPSVSVTNGAYSVNLQASRVNENTVDGIGQMVKGSRKLFTEMVHGIIRGNYRVASKDQEQYNRFKNEFDIQTRGLTIAQKQKFAEIFVEGYMKTYADKLYNNAKGTNINTFGISMVSISGFSILPVLTFGGEHISTSYREVVRNADQQEAITAKEMSISELGGSFVNINGHKVLKLPTDFYVKGGRGRGKLNISSGDANGQVVEKGGYYYIGGVDLSNVRLIEQTKSSTVKRILVLNGGQKDSEGLYINNISFRNTITRSISGAGGANSGILKLSENVSDKVKNIGDIQSRLFSREVIRSGSSQGFMDLQRQIYNFKTNGNPLLNQVWNQYITVLRNPVNQRYIENKGGNASNLIGLLNGINSNEEKVYILQSLSLSFTARETIFTEGNKLNLPNTALRNYENNHNRGAFFDQVFQNELPGVKQQVTRARNGWSQKYLSGNGNNSVTKINGLGFSATEMGLGSNKTNRLSPLTGGIDVIGNPNDFPITLSKEAKRQIVNKIPEYILQNTLNKINSQRNTKLSMNEFKNGLINDKFGVLKAYFVRNAQCVNDAIIIDIASSGGKISVSNVSSAVVQKNSFFEWGFAAGGKLKEKTKKSEDEGSTPGDDGVKPFDDGKVPDDGKPVPDDGKPVPDDGKPVPDDGKKIPDDQGSTPGDEGVIPFRDGGSTPGDGGTGGKIDSQSSTPIDTQEIHIYTPPSVNTGSIDQGKNPGR